ncbi:(deoxy)nucleoside triphosphate pyrophosphohydrolase [Sphingomonas parva]|nr:(deoxy)nucleoside triphosphate pyrophosphohydrolase [Sphingomonas parva]
MIVVAAALIDDQGRILLQQRAPGRSMAGLWEFPGGKMEAGERPETALARELEEELGLAVAAEALVPITFASADLPGGGGRHMLLLLYTCRTWDGMPEALDAAALAWVHPSEMRLLPMPPADIPFIPILEAVLGV